MSTERAFDVILLGATGFTGALVAEYLATHYGTETKPLRWAMAGRNQQKLEKTQAKIAETAPRIKEIPILLADSNDLDSLKKLVAQTTAICSTVGPFMKYGSKLVEACVAEETHYCDITGEVPWVRKMIDAHHEEAKAKNIRIVPFSGFDSIPSDLGTLMVQNAMKEKHGVPCEQVKFFFGPAKAAVSGGTLATMMNMMAEAKKDKSIRRALGNPYALYPKDAPKGPDGSDQRNVRWDQDQQVWTAPFVMAGTNTRVVRRSNALMAFAYGENFKYSEVQQFPKGFSGWFGARKLAMGLGAFVVMVLIPFTRKILQATVLPKPGDGPSKAEREAGFFEAHFLGMAGEHRIKGMVRGEKDPGYGETALMLAESAICLALEQDKMPENYGVVTTASGMGEALIQKLRDAGMTFEITSS